MDDEELLNLLNSLSEDEMIEKVIIPLYKKRFKGEFHDIEFTGKDKREDGGIDITYYEISRDTKTKDYSGVQVKQGEINTSKGANGIAAITIQAQQAITKEIPHVTDKKKYRIRKYVVLTSGDIQPRARVQIVDEFAHKEIKFVDGKMLCVWIRESFLSEIKSIFDISNEDRANEDSDDTPLDVVMEHLEKKCRVDIDEIKAVYKVLDRMQQDILKVILELGDAKSVAIAAKMGIKATHIEEDLKSMCHEEVLDVSENGYSLANLSSMWRRIEKEFNSHIELLGYDNGEVDIKDVISEIF